ncbi:fimbrial protein [Rahnella variigena]|jgi:type 1 fimbria pilin|uniref:fimbrial protein n=1 Tax=Rahnella variigena TaxID=574964 RepID=UPI002711FB4A|nr:MULTISPECIES: fimbrial protein [Rahnella]
MNNKAIVIFIFIFQFAFVSAHADDDHALRGRVHMQGSIINAACSIDIDSREQSVDLGGINLADIIRDGQSRSKLFSIHLINCVFDHANENGWKNFQVTFDGEYEGGLFSIHGEATGIGLQVIDELGNIVTPGKPLPIVNVTPENMQLNYALKLVENNQELSLGEYFSSILFKTYYF